MDLMKKLERVLDLLIVVLEKQANPLTPAADVYPRAEAAPTDAPAVPPKTRKTKAAPAPAPAVPPAAPSDPLMQAESPAPAAAAAPAAPAAAVVMTEDQSLERAKELAKLIVEAYPEKEVSGDKTRPKGFRLAMELLSKFKVARTTDLVHAQRLQFIAEGDVLLKNAPVAA